MPIDFKKIERKWQKQWQKRKSFEAEVMNKPKFFVTFPYPYVNGLAHAGHTYTLSRVDLMARYKRMKGFNVLFPQGFHATGAPIDTAAKKVKENNEKQIKILNDMGFTDTKPFEESLHWIKTFSKTNEDDYKSLGCSIDWRRTFITTDLNPRYSKFIQWQFRQLKNKGLVVKGEHPVVWCPAEKCPVGDHARDEGEGEAPEQMVLIKFTLNDLVLPAATFRPETTFGVTNMWINPDLDYIEAQVDKEKWIVTEPTLKKLENQKHTVLVLRTFKGKEIIGKICKNPVTGKDVPILTASFVSADNGTGVVMSVPSHAPYDWIALKDLMDVDKTIQITPVSLIQVSGYGEHPAIEICDRLQIKNQTETAKLDEATQEIYKKEFHTGRLKPNTGKFAGKTVQEAKPLIIEDWGKEGKAAILFELMNPVVCRCKSRCVVRIVDDQWFLKYGDVAWKEQTKKALTQCKIYPEKTRSQFEHVIDWLNDWACTREFGLGTDLPWDKKWKIESLSDSTIYMAFYTIVHKLKKITLGKINDKLFNFVFLGQGNPGEVASELGLEENKLNELRTEFNYWYPVDFRNSGKDLVQNHLTFFLFNHVSVFPEKYWPTGIGVNGFVTLGEIKMSKSKGNVKYLRQLVDEFSADVVRITILSNAEEVEDPSWDTDAAINFRNRLEQWYNFAIENYENGEAKEIDRWMESKLNECVKKTTSAMEGTLYRSAVLYGFFDLQRALKWYLKRGGKALLKRVVETQTLLLAPFTPHICEEIWQKLGKGTLVSLDKWPEYDESKILRALDESEDYLQSIMNDVQSVVKLAKIEKPQKVTLFVADSWKHKAIHAIKEKLKTTRNQGDVFKALMQDEELKKHGQDMPKIVQKCMSEMPIIIEAEIAFLQDAKTFLEKETGLTIDIVKENATQEPKAKQALPGKPAILLS